MCCIFVAMSLFLPPEVILSSSATQLYANFTRTELFSVSEVHSCFPMVLCSVGPVRLCPSDTTGIITGQNIRKLIKDGFVIKKPEKVHSRARTNAWAEAKRKVRGTPSPSNRESCVSNFRSVRRDGIWDMASVGAPRRRVCQ